MNKILEEETIKKSINILAKNLEISPIKIINSIYSREIMKIKIINDGNQYHSFESIINDISFGKTNNVIDYFEQKEVYFENRNFMLVDYREIILILSLLLEILPENKIDYKLYYDDLININSQIYTSFDNNEPKYYAALENFNENLNWIKLNFDEGNYLSFDIKDAFNSLNLNLFFEKIEREIGSSKNLDILKTILTRISSNNGIPLFFGAEIISRIIWNYVFIDIVRKLHKDLYPESNIVTFVDEVWIATRNNFDIYKEIIKISSFLKEYNIEINGEKINEGTINTISSKQVGYHDSYQLYYKTISDIDEHVKLEIIRKVTDIESEFINDIIEKPWNKKSARVKRDLEYSKILDEYEIYINSEQFHVLIKLLSPKDDKNHFDKIDNYIEKYIYYVKTYPEFMDEDEYLFYLLLIDSKNPTGLLQEHVIDLIKSKESKIISSFSIRHDSKIFNEKLKWIYNMNRGNEFNIKSEIYNEMLYNLKLSEKFSIEEYWNEGSLWLLINQNNLYSKDAMVIATTVYSLASWFYNSYINAHPTDVCKIAENNLNKFISDNGLINLAKFRHNSPISHTPTEKSAKFTSELIEKKLNLNDIFEELKKLII